MNKYKTITFENPVIESGSVLSYNIARRNISEIFPSMNWFCRDKTVVSYKQDPVSELDYNLIQNMEIERYKQIMFRFHAGLIEKTVKISKTLDRVVILNNGKVFSDYRSLLYVDYCNPSISSCPTQIGNDLFEQILNINSDSVSKIKDLEYTINHTNYIVDCSILIVNIFGEKIYDALDKTVDNLANENMLDDELREKYHVTIDKVFSLTMQEFVDENSAVFSIAISSLYRQMIEARKRMFC